MAGPGDLGLQKGLIRWYAFDKPAILPAKIVKPVAPLSPSKSESDVFSSPSRETSEIFSQPILPAETPANPAEPLTDLPDSLIEPLKPPGSPVNGRQVGQIKEDDFPAAPLFPESETLTKEKLRARLSKKIK